MRKAIQALKSKHNIGSMNSWWASLFKALLGINAVMVPISITYAVRITSSLAVLEERSFHGAAEMNVVKEAQKSNTERIIAIEKELIKKRIRP